MNDAHRVELALLPILMKDVMVATTADYKPSDKLMNLLDSSVLAAVDNVTDDKRHKLLKRAYTVRRDMLHAYKDPKALGMVVYSVMRLLTDRGYLEIGEQTDFYAAITLYLDHVSELGTSDEFDAACEQLAGPTIKFFQSRNLFSRFNPTA